jgi:hypothetical protein
MANQRTAAASRSGTASTMSREASISRMAGINARLSYKRDRRRSETVGASVNPDNPQHWAALFPRGRPFFTKSASEEPAGGAQSVCWRATQRLTAREFPNARGLAKLSAVLSFRLPSEKLRKRIAVAVFLYRETLRLREPHAGTQLDFLKSSDARYAICLWAFGASTQSLICA